MPNRQSRGAKAFSQHCSSYFLSAKSYRVANFDELAAFPGLHIEGLNIYPIVKAVA
jgi:hypothetical protein